MTQTRPALPASFEFGVATASYQIEGAVHEDGRGPVDLGHVQPHARARSPGRHRRRGLRPLPPLPRGRRADGASSASTATGSPSPGRASSRRGEGPANAGRPGLLRPAGRRAARARHRPAVTLYHWDLPQALRGRRRLAGPRHRRALRRVRRGRRRSTWATACTAWITLNEPFCSSILGYSSGRHAPGAQEGHGALAAAHHLLLGHGLAVQRLRPRLAEGDQLGITLNLQPVTPVSDSEADRAAADRALLLSNRLFTDPVLAGATPSWRGGRGARSPTSASCRMATSSSSGRRWTSSG